MNYTELIGFLRVNAQTQLKSEQSTQKPTNSDEVTPPEPSQTSESAIISSARELGLSFSVLLFGVLTLGLECILVKNLRDKVSSQEILSLFTVTLIIVGTLFLISAGFDASQIAPALGLYGTIVGYLLGRESERQVNNNNKKEGSNE